MSRASEPVERAARDRVQRIVMQRAAEPGAVGWVPDSPRGPGDGRLRDDGLLPGGLVPDDPLSDDLLLDDPLLDDPAEGHDLPDEDDVRDVVARMRAGALDAAAAAYTAAHGHPLEHRAADLGPRRWHLSVRLAVVAGIAIAVLVAGVVARATLTAPTAPTESTASVASSAAPRASAGPTGTGSGAVSGQGLGGASSPSPGTVVVHVVGQVVAPGLVWLRAGSRVSDAVAAAGGAAPGADLAAVNLARVVGDGEQIVVPAPVPGAAPGAVAAPAAGSGGKLPAGPVPLVDLNSADLAALDALPGIGPVLAQRILDWRGKHGRFSDVAELGEVPGIGDKLLGQLRDLVRV